MRPSCTVIVPVGPGVRDVCAIALDLRAGDEILVAHNASGPLAVPPGARVIDARGPASSYFARDRAAAAAHGDWLVFLDADTVPERDLLDAYFATPPAERTAVLAGGIEDWTDEDTLVARYVAARRKLGDGPADYAQTANCAVRREAFAAVGGFPDAVRSGGDADLCWRLAAAGWELEPRPAARVRHRNRASLRALLGQLHRHGAGMQWLWRRYPERFPPPRPRELAGRLKLLRGGRYGAIDFLALWARDFGRLRANGDPTPGDAWAG